MNINQLRAFIAVVDHGSFSEAARAMGLSQPAVTMQIQGLESDLGATLLERRYRKVELTEAGRALLPFARRVMAELDEARTEIERLSDTVGGHLELAVSTTPGQYILPRLLGSFLRAYPEVSVSLRVYDSADVVARVESGEAHLGMTGARASRRQGRVRGDGHRPAADDLPARQPAGGTHACRSPRSPSARSSCARAARARAWCSSRRCATAASTRPTSTS